jgi:hypothetical protein
MMSIILKTIVKLMGWSSVADEFWERFVKPQVERLYALNVDPSDISLLINKAIDEADPLVIGRAPGSLLRDMVDRIEAGETVESVLK